MVQKAAGFSESVTLFTQRLIKPRWAEQHILQPAAHGYGSLQIDPEGHLVKNGNLPTLAEKLKRRSASAPVVLESHRISERPNKPPMAPI